MKTKKNGKKNANAPEPATAQKAQAGDIGLKIRPEASARSSLAARKAQARSKGITVEDIEVGRISPNPANPRTAGSPVDDLVESVREYGIINPVTVSPAGPGSYVVIAGSRRLAAAKAAGLATVPCVVRDADPATMHDIATIENIARRQMDPADECVAVQKMLREGRTPRDVAATFGRTPRWAVARARMAELGPEVLDMMRAGTVTLAHAEELCDLHDTDRVIEEAKRCAWRSPAQIRDEIDAWMRAVSSAPFDSARVCARCPRRTSVMTDLFADTADDRCTDPGCWEKNVRKFVSRKRAALERQGYKVSTGNDDSFGWVAIPADTKDDEKAKIVADMRDAGIKPRVHIGDDGKVTEGYFADDSPERAEIERRQAEAARGKRMEREKDGVRRAMRNEALFAAFTSGKSELSIAGNKFLATLLLLVSGGECVTDDALSLAGVPRLDGNDEWSPRDFLGWAETASDAQVTELAAEIITESLDYVFLDRLAARAGIVVDEDEVEARAKKNIEEKDEEERRLVAECGDGDDGGGTEGKTDDGDR